MTRQQGNYVDVNHLRQGAPVNNTFAETIPRVLAGNDGAIAATGVVLSTAVALQGVDPSAPGGCRRCEHLDHLVDGA